MRRCVVKPFAYSLLLVILCAASRAEALTSGLAPGVVQKVKRAVVVVKTFDAQGKPLLRGSGFIIGSGMIVTNRHVLEGASDAEIKTHDGASYRARGLAAVNDSQDLALIDAGIPAGAFTPIETARASVAPGQEVFVVSHPRGSAWKTTRGTVVEVWHFQDLGDLIRITAGIAPGSSGGPVVNLEGELVGIATRHTQGGEDLNFALPGSLLSTLKAGATIPLPGSLARRNLAER